MTNKDIGRRGFIAGSLAAGAAMTRLGAGDPVAEGVANQEFYELRIYRSADVAKQGAVLDFVEKTLCPALNRQGHDRIGIFKPVDPKDTSIHVTVPYASLDHLAVRNDRLEADEEFQKAARPFFALPRAEAAYTRIDTRLMRAFAGMPMLAEPARKSTTRIVELRIYESHNEHRARLKVEMFNKGEIDIMRDVGLAPVFFGETLIANDVPNLTYMLSADSPAAHKEHWQAFLKHPEWERMKKMPRYRGTVSKIVSVTMTPTPGSQV